VAAAMRPFAASTAAAFYIIVKLRDRSDVRQEAFLPAPRSSAQQ